MVESGNFDLHLISKGTNKMNQLLGEYECKIDDKNRMRLPSGLISQFGKRETYTFVLNRNLDVSGEKLSAHCSRSKRITKQVYKTAEKWF